MTIELTTAMTPKESELMRMFRTNWCSDKTKALMVGCLLVALAISVVPSSAWAQGRDCEKLNDETEEERRFRCSQGVLLDYMSRSVAFMNKGHEKAFTGFEYWYIKQFLPSRDSAPGIEKAFRYLVEELALLGVSAFIPNKGVFVVDVLDSFSKDAYSELASSMNGVSSQKEFSITLKNQLVDLQTSLLSLPNVFEMEHPTLFEDLMFQYYHEELETPGIHWATDYGIGAETRAMLKSQGFPEPRPEEALEFAERLLTSMIYDTKIKYDYVRDTAESLAPEQIKIDARINARRFLYPNDPEYYCEGARMLFSFMPKDCR